MSALSILFGVLMFATALFLILLILVQRGRGGGLSGALGGMGGQSAFGTKAGDLFTRITIVAATVWILLCIFAILLLNRQSAPERPGGASNEYDVVDPTGGDSGSEAKPRAKSGDAEETGTGEAEAGGGEAEAGTGEAESGTGKKEAGAGGTTGSAVEAQKTGDAESGDAESGDAESGDAESGDAEADGTDSSSE